RADAAEEVDIQGRLEVPAREVLLCVAVSPYVLFGAQQSPQLHARLAIQLKVMRHRLAGHPCVQLVRCDRELHDMHEVGDVGVGVVASVEVFDAKLHLGLAVLRGARRERLEHLLEAVIDRIFAGDALVQLGQLRPPRAGDEMFGCHLLEEPARAAKLEVDAERRLQECCKAAVQLLDKDERRHADDLDLSVKPQAWVWLGLAFAVRQRLDGHEVAVVAQFDPRHRNARTWSRDVRAVSNMHQAAGPPGALYRGAQVRDQLVEALDERPCLASALDVITVLANGPQVVLPAGRHSASQRDDARLHYSIPLVYSPPPASQKDRPTVESALDPSRLIVKCSFCNNSRSNSAIR